MTIITPQAPVGTLTSRPADAPGKRAPHRPGDGAAERAGRLSASNLELVLTGIDVVLGRS